MNSAEFFILGNAALALGLWGVKGVSRLLREVFFKAAIITGRGQPADPLREYWEWEATR